MDGYAKLDHYYNLLQKIFKLINDINNENNIKIKIIKIKSHSNIRGNDIVDLIAKKGASMAMDAKNGNNKLIYNGINNPMIVDNFYYNESLKEIIKRERLDKWMAYERNIIENENMFKCENLYLEMLKNQCMVM